MSKTLEVDLQQVIVGSRLRFPILDTQGVLLLAAGHEYTAEHRTRLIARGVLRVKIDESDLDKVLNAAINAPAKSGEDLRRVEAMLNQRFDDLIATGALSVRNSEDQVKDTIIRHGARDYSPFHKRRVEMQQAEAEKALDALAESVQEKGTAEAAQVESAADAFIRSLVTDIGCCLSVSGLKRHLPSITEHSVNIAVLAMAIGVEMGLDAPNLRILGMAGLLEDLGMSLVPEAIRNSPRKLSDVEFIEIQRHTVHTANMLGKIPNLPPIVGLIAYQAHERPDGSGYPRGLMLNSIHSFARVLHVANTYTSLTTQRPFRRPLKPYSAMECLVRMAHQGKVDRDVIKNLLQVQSLFPIGSYVRLSDDSIARVIRSNGENYTRPIVTLSHDHPDSPISASTADAVIDLMHSELKIVEGLPTPGADELDLSPEVLGWSERGTQALAQELTGSQPAAVSKPALATAG